MLKSQIHLFCFTTPTSSPSQKTEKLRLENFLKQNWDRLLIKSYTDETEAEDYNMELSKKRSAEVYNYFASKNVPAYALSIQFFGETMPVADNSSDDGRALNRRTEIIGYRLPRVQIQPRVDPMKPVTNTLDNGFIITYKPGSLPASWLYNFESGWGNNFKVVTNTVEMRQNNLFNNTTNNEILSSVMIVCGQNLDTCKLDTPILVKVPIPFKTKCPIEKVKFFNAIAEKGKQIWQEETKELYPEVINGIQYIGIWIDDFCQCINFDFKVDPDCFDMDSSKLMYVNAGIKNLTAELIGLNSVYMPRKSNDSTHNILYLKENSNGALVSFSLYNGKRRIRTFRDQKLSSFPYDESEKTYLLTTDTIRFQFPGMKFGDVAMKVNGDKYRTFIDKSKCEIIYLNRETEKIMVDLSVFISKKKYVFFKNQPLTSLPFDEKTGSYVVDKEFLKLLGQMGMVSMK